jgi:hypothetical protein
MKSFSKIVDANLSDSWNQLLDQTDYDIWFGLENKVLHPVDPVLDLCKLIGDLFLSDQFGNQVDEIN